MSSRSGAKSTIESTPTAISDSFPQICLSNTGNKLNKQSLFPVKYRKALLSEQVVEELKVISLQLQDRYEVEIESLGCDGDHIHLFCGSHPKYAPGQLVRVYKSVTAKELFRWVPGLRVDLWGGEMKKQRKKKKC